MGHWPEYQDRDYLMAVLTAEENVIPYVSRALQIAQFEVPTSWGINNVCWHFSVPLSRMCSSVIKLG